MKLRRLYKDIITQNFPPLINLPVLVYKIITLSRLFYSIAAPDAFSWDERVEDSSIFYSLSWLMPSPILRWEGDAWSLQWLEEGKESAEISPLQYADDTSLFLRSAAFMVFGTWECWYLFSKASNIQVNLGQSLSSNGTFRWWCAALPGILGCRMKTTWLFRPPFGLKLEKCWFLGKITENSKSCIYGMRVMSFRGRITLIKAALTNLRIYSMQLFKSLAGQTYDMRSTIVPMNEILYSPVLKYKGVVLPRTVDNRPTWFGMELVGGS